VDKYAPYLAEYMVDYGIKTNLQQQHFFAQILHESGGMCKVVEDASGEKYEWKKILGNIYEGDGKKFKGRGLMQLTGRYNYGECSKALFGDDRLLENPKLLEDPKYAVESACWFWNYKKLNNIADKYEAINDDYVKEITYPINKELDGLDKRIEYFRKMKKSYNKYNHRTHRT
jgi:putative chitinase